MLTSRIYRSRLLTYACEWSFVAKQVLNSLYAVAYILDSLRALRDRALESLVSC